MREMQDEADASRAVRDARARVDAARALHARLRREVDLLQLNPRRNQLALERFRTELERARCTLREATRGMLRQGRS